jgi:hypothetical protein
VGRVAGSCDIFAPASASLCDVVATEDEVFGVQASPFAIS